MRSSVMVDCTFSQQVVLASACPWRVAEAVEAAARATAAETALQAERASAQALQAAPDPRELEAQVSALVSGAAVTRLRSSPTGSAALCAHSVMLQRSGVGTCFMQWELEEHLQR